MGRAIDALITFRFLKLLVTPFNKTKAYELGIIDERGKNLIKSRDLNTIEMRNSYTILHKLVFNIKKLIEKLPGGKSRLASYAAALFLIKENTELSDFKLLEKEFHKYLKENDLIEPYDNTIIREVIDFTDKLTKGQYKLINDIYTDKDTEVVAKRGDTVSVFGDTAAVDTVMGVEIFPVVHDKSKSEIYVSIEDLEEIQ
jgi:DNA repair exonuclease SbcCD ATPase subunit|tara:strand:+ start:1293 stop:1892 length:600 start_codon:yes stop_codon:yes gene_type:complete